MRPRGAIACAITATACAIISALSCAGCRQQEGDGRYGELTSGMGLGISIGQSREQVRAVLGLPHSSKDDVPGFAEDYYVTEPFGVRVEMPDLNAAQLTLTYVDGALVKLYNHYDPVNPGSPLPPYLVEPAPGVKLGSRRSDLEAALGPGNYGLANDAWRFESADGRAVVIQPQFVEVPAPPGERLCGTLALSVEAAEAGRGEYFEKQREKKQRVKDL